MGVSKNRGTPKWMVYKENPIKMDDLGGKPTIFGNIQMLEVCVLKSLKLTVIHIQLWMWMWTRDVAGYAQSCFSFKAAH